MGLLCHVDLLCTGAVVVNLEIPVENHVRRVREEQGLSQQRLGEILGVSRQTVNSIENGRYDPSLPLAFKISRHFKLTIEELFDALE